jgi:uncharacterized protein (TIGR03435 family)
LQALQDAFKDQLRVITVTAEPADRIGQYLRNRPSNLWFAIDTTRRFEALFPFRMIPHAVLIDADGIVRAITDPASITEKAIGDLIAGKAISLPVKEDLLGADPESILNNYFAATPQTASRFMIHPAIPNARSFSTLYVNNADFRNRRMTMVNMPLSVLYRMAHGDVSHLRTVDLQDDPKSPLTKADYCLDVIVAKGKEAELRPFLQEELNKSFAIRGKLEKQIKPVYVLQIVDAAKAGRLTPSTRTEQSLVAGGSGFEGQEVTIRELADYLENFGIVNLPVVDETGLTAVYDISLQFEPENKESLTAALQRLGLRLTQSEREIEVLVLR